MDVEKRKGVRVHTLHDMGLFLLNAVSSVSKGVAKQAAAQIPGTCRIPNLATRTVLAKVIKTMAVFRCTCYRNGFFM
eukprot:3326302-Amphidinium_carterae.1